MPDHAQPATAMNPSALPASAGWPRLILGSTSPYRRELLSRLGLPFDTRAPRVDEQAEPGEIPRDLAWRLARAKAQDVAAQLAEEDRHARVATQAADRGLLVIGSDQVAELDGRAIGKPGTHERAAAQLRAMSGREVLFHTAVCVVRQGAYQTGQPGGYLGTRLHTVRVQFRELSDADIETYLRSEQPYDCAGSAKAEGLGIVLLARIHSDDPSALIGLPLIDTCELLREAGVDPLAWRATLAPL